MKQIIILIITLSSLVVYSQKDSLKIVELEHSLSLMEKNLNQISTNQLNYQIEKDLLKETYSNNYSRIQTFITLLLGLISVLGFLGINSINKTKKEYESELENFKQIKSNLESDYESLKASQETFDEKINKIDNLNQQQDIKLKILDVKEKASRYIVNRAYGRALEYITIGLELDPKDIGLLNAKAKAHFKLKEYTPAIQTHLQILELDPENIESICEITELYLITENTPEFIKHRRKYKTELEVSLKKPINIFFEAFYQYSKSNEQEIEKLTQKILELLSDENEKKKIMQWDFSDVKEYLSEKENNSVKIKLNYFINIAKGGWSKKNYQDAIESK